MPSLLNQGARIMECKLLVEPSQQVAISALMFVNVNVGIYCMTLTANSSYLSLQAMPEPRGLGQQQEVEGVGRIV